MTETVSVTKSSEDYEKSLSEAIDKVLSDLGGIERFVKRGDTSRIKAKFTCFLFSFKGYCDPSFLHI